MYAPKPLPPLSWLRAFEAAARHLSFTSAASELNMSQSAVSQNIRALETYLERKLFVRGSRTLQLTEDGSNYLPVIREGFQVLQSGTNAFIGDRGATLYVQANMAFSTFWLTPRLEKLYRRYPWLTMQLITPVWDTHTNQDLINVEIRFGRAADFAHSAAQLSSETCFPVCAPQIADADWRKTTLFDVTGVNATWDHWAQARGEPRPATRKVNLSSTYVTTINAAKYGAGMALGHPTIVDDLIRSGQLSRPFPETISMPEGYFLLPPSPHNSTPASRAFCEWILEEFSHKNR